MQITNHLHTLRLLIDVFTNPALGGVKFATTSAKVPLNASSAALFQVPRSTTLMKEFLIQAPKTFAVASQAGRYASGGSAAYTIDEKFTEVVNSIKFY